MQFDDINRPLGSTFDEVASRLKQLSGRWLIESNGRVVYHGTKKEITYDDIYQVMTLKPYRPPRDSLPTANDAYNEMLSMVGSNVTRNNSIFVTGSVGISAGYGQPTVAIPLGDYEYVWSTEYYDLSSQLTITDLFSHYLDDSKVSREDILLMKQYLLDTFIDNRPYQIQIKMESSAKNLAIYFNNNIRRKVLMDIFGGRLAQVLDQQKIKDIFQVNSGLEQAIRVEHEILVKCQKVALIKPSVYSEFIVPRLV